MNPLEARAILARELAQWRQRPYADLVACIDADPATGEVHSSAGARYGFEVQVFWDAKPGGNVRVLGAIDDGGLRAFRPLTDGFLMAPDGSFVEEEPA